MSNSSAQYSQYPQHQAHDHGRSFHRRPATAPVATSIPLPDTDHAYTRARGHCAQPRRRGTQKQTNTADTGTCVASPEADAAPEAGAPTVGAPPVNQFATNQGFDNVLVRLTPALDQVERRQIAALSAV